MPLRPAPGHYPAARRDAPSAHKPAPTHARSAGATATIQEQRPRSTPPAITRPSAVPPPVVPEVLQEITITEGVTVKELSEKMDRKAKDIITRLLGRGIMATINQPLDITVARRSAAISVSTPR